MELLTYTEAELEDLYNHLSLHYFWSLRVCVCVTLNVAFM